MYKSKLKINNKVGALNLSSIRYRTVTYRFSLEFLSTLAVSRREPSRIFGPKIHRFPAEKLKKKYSTVFKIKTV
jgi:hypothetical protein